METKNAVKIIALDFDGCIVTNKYPEIGEPIWKNIKKLKEEIANGAKTILWTCRVDEYLEAAVNFCNDNGIHLDAVNENLPEVVEAFGSNQRKIFANEYWDDRAVLMSEQDIGDFSDGHHTFNSLYEQRLMLSAALFNTLHEKAWKSWRHSDGEPCFDGECFIVGIDTPMGPYTYHYKGCWWGFFNVKELERAPQWDGHTDKEVSRLLSLCTDGQWIAIEERLPQKPDYDWVLVRCKMDPEEYYGLPHIAELRNGIWYSDCYDGPLEETAGVKVTHWMPLPDDPVERKRNGKMSKVFLGGTCNGSTWREKLIPLLKIDYFNPVVEDWTPECQKEEYRQKQICNLHLYVITPKMTGTYSIAELIDSSNKNPKGTVFMVLTEDDGLRFDEGQLRSLRAVTDMAKKNGAEGVFDSFEELTSILNRK
jgi:hypothetical protein